MSAADRPKKAATEADPLAWIDSLLFVTLLAFAGLIGSSVVRNSDVWRHLATGRAIASGASISEEPFRAGAEAQSWTNPSWLYDVILYTVHVSGGDASLVWAKAVAAVLFALALGFAAWCDRAGWWAVAMIGLAVMAAAPRFTGQFPAVWSFVMTAVLLNWLRLPAGTVRTTGIAVTIAIWSNVDAWFILGPVIVALDAIGALIPPRDRSVGRLFVDVGVAVVAGCVNPGLWKAYFALPDELAMLTMPGEVRHDPLLQLYLVRTTSAAYWANAGALAGGSYLVLLLLGGVSFGFAGPAGQRWLPLWLALAMVSWFARLVPFFAAVSAVVIVANTRSALARHPRIGTTAGLMTARLVTLAVLAGLFWLWPQLDSKVPCRQIGWWVAADPAQKLLAERIAAAYRDNTLNADDRLIFFVPEMAHYAVWASPQARVNIDSRVRVYRDAWPDFLRARKLVNQVGAKQPLTADEANWLQTWYDGQKATAVVVSGRNDRETLGLAGAYSADNDRWSLWHVTGRNAVFGRLTRKPPLAQNVVDLAFRRAEPLRYQPAEAPPVRSRWDFAPPPAEPPSAGEAALWLELFDTAVGRTRYADSLSQLWMFASWPGGYAAIAGGFTPLDPRLFSEEARAAAGPLKLLKLKLASDDESLAMPLLALRAARRATLERPDLPAPYLSLARAAQIFPTNATIQRLNALSAMRAALDRRGNAVAAGTDPDALAHVAYGTLAEAFGRDQIDQKFEATREAMKLFPRVFGAVLKPEAMRQQMQAQEERLNKLEEYVHKVRDDFELKSQNLPSPEKVQVAVGFGLTGEALSILSGFPDETLGPGGGSEKANLLLRSGRAEAARKLLLSQYFNPVTVLPADKQPTFRFFHLQAAAAVGDFDRAQEELSASLTNLAKYRQELQGRPLGLLAGLLLAPDPHPLGRASPPKTEIWWSVAQQFHVARIQQIDLHVWRGMLALEQGDLPTAKRHLSAALAAGPGVNFDGKLAAERYVKLLPPN